MDERRSVHADVADGFREDRRDLVPKRIGRLGAPGQHALEPLRDRFFASHIRRQSVERRVVDGRERVRHLAYPPVRRIRRRQRRAGQARHDDERLADEVAGRVEVNWARGDRDRTRDRGQRGIVASGDRGRIPLLVPEDANDVLTDGRGAL